MTSELTTGACFTNMVISSDSLEPAGFVAETLNLYVPNVFATPEISPVCELRVSPNGSSPELTLKVVDGLSATTTSE